MAQEIAKAVVAYSEALQRLTAEADDKSIAAEAVMACLLSRDAVQKAVAGDSQPVPATLVQLVALDADLRAQTEDVIEAVDLSVWRKTVQPKPERWWWFLDQEVIERERRADVLWMVLAGLSFSLAVSLALDVSQRLWSGGPDLTALLVSVVQLLLTGGVITRRGRELSNLVLSGLRIHPRYQAQAMAGAAALFFVLMLALRLALPAMALAYNNRAYTHMQAGRLAQARRSLERAVSLDPGLASAYYNLAALYEDITEYDQAMALYRQALEYDLTFDLPYNNLARLYLIQGQAGRAIVLLRNGLTVAQDDVTRYAMRKNLGWAYYQTEQHDLARDELEMAVALQPDQAPAYYYLALTYEALKEPEAAITAWENCLRHIKYDDPEESGWAPVARAHLQKLREEKP